jgi:Cu(I)/Ag(I) efflux system membrane fusion protein
MTKTRARWRAGAPGLAAALALAGCGAPRSEPAAVRSGGVELRAAVEPAAPRVGENRLHVELRDAQGRRVDAREVSVEVRMPAMGAMPAMGGPAAVTERDDGRFEADFELGMSGTWQVAIRAETAAGPARAQGSLVVGTPGLRLEATGAAAPAPAPEPAVAPPATHAHERAAEPGRAAHGEHPGEFALAPERVQRIGVRTARAERAHLTTPIRALGVVRWDETALEDVSLKVRGWVGRLEVDAVGDPVEKGQVLFTLYSPELYAAQEEYLQALRSRERAKASGAPERADRLVRAARNRLRLWDVSAGDLAAVEREGEPLDELPIRAPASGFVVAKAIVAGSGIEPGTRLYRIAPLDRVWVDAEVYETELPWVREGQPVRVELPYGPALSVEARVARVYPELRAETRTARVRIELPNPGLALRPDMYADVEIDVDRGERLLVPQSAVLHAGDRSFVFLALGEGRFRPREVTTGLRAGERVEVVAGLEGGEEVVASGTFLIAAESRLRAALEQW